VPRREAEIAGAFIIRASMSSTFDLHNFFIPETDGEQKVIKWAAGISVRTLALGPQLI
jgi:hypothetical protein